MNMTSFSELAFKFRITPALLGAGLLFSALMGAVGGLLPALRALLSGFEDTFAIRTFQDIYVPRLWSVV